MPPHFRAEFFANLRLVLPHLTVASLALGALHQPAHAASVTFRWDYTASGAAGFKLHCGPSSRNYVSHVDVGNTDSYTLTSLPEGATSLCAVTAYDPARVESSYSEEVSVVVPAPTSVSVDFSASTTSGAAPLNVAFTNRTTGPVTSWAWNFGDGTTSNLQNPTHVYSTPGSYTVVLTATKSDGSTVSKTASAPIQVASPPPSVNFSASRLSGTAPLKVAFSNTTTGKVTQWQWSFGDGTSSTRNSPSHVYKTPGTYTVTLTAIGPGGTSKKTLTGGISVTAPQ